MKKKSEEKENLIFRIIQYGIDHNEFLLKDMYEELGITDGADRRYIYDQLLFHYGGNNPNHILTVMTRYSSVRSMTDIEHLDLVRVLPTAIFSYVDHLEIIEARKVAKGAREMSERAHKLSIKAIWISSIIGGVSLIVGLIQVLIAISNS